ncbi:MAG: aspartate-semialdehyde dehydrogenase [Armatimonadota bacterium]|jgi:aspartate-semialdehyde dehydrogenase|nr:aspartate-semialdehyde dehydrogenase [Fimbriimonadaceae bacterium]MCZ8139914.1 aspartate-semialdehyde dehydrogenase [Fimbriimonadaceae bacterium]
MRIGIVGATGAVGREIMEILAERKLPMTELRLLASARSAGTKLPFQGEEIEIQTARPEALTNLDYVLLSAGSGPSLALAGPAQAAGAVVIDNSSAFRMEPGVPLVVPEVNGHLISRQQTLYPVGNCTAILLVMALTPIHRAFPIERVIVSTYQSASGAGAAAMEELQEQTQAFLNQEPVVPRIMPHPYAFNLFSHNTTIDDTGWNGEECKVRAEARKIMEAPDLQLNVTCVRVPVLRAHTETVHITFQGNAPTEDQVRELCAVFPGVRVVDDRANNHFPMPVDSSHGDEVLVGRFRRDPDDVRGFNLMLSGDQLRKGAALNAVQILEAHAALPASE